MWDPKIDLQPFRNFSQDFSILLYAITITRIHFKFRARDGRDGFQLD